MKISQLYVVTIKNEEYKHFEKAAFTTMYEANYFIQTCKYCAWGEKAETKIEIMEFDGAKGL